MGPENTQSPPFVGTPEPQRAGQGAEHGDTSLSEAVATLRKRRWILILAGILGVGYGLYNAYTQPRLFDAVSTIQVHSGASNAYKLESSFSSGDSQSKMNTEAAILKSDTLMETVARELHLDKNPDFSGVSAHDRRATMDDPVVRASVIGTLQANLSVTPISRTELIRIAYSSLDPNLSAEIVNTVVSDYIHRSYETPAKQTQQVSEWLSGQLDDLKTKVEESQEQMLDLQKKLGVLGYDSKDNQLETSLDQLMTAEGAAKIARITAEARYRMIAGMDPNTIEESIETTPGTAPYELNLLRSQLASVRANYAHMTAPGVLGLGPNNPKIKAMQDEIGELTKAINEEQNRLQVQAREIYLAAKATEDKTEQELESRKAQVYDQGNDVVRYTLLQREYEQYRTLYDGLQQRLATARVEAGLDAVEVDPVDKAVPPVSPTLRSKSSIVMTDAVLFLLGGIVIAFIVESLDTGLGSIQQIEEVLDMPSLSIIPKGKRPSTELTTSMSTAQRNIQVLTQPKSQFTEAFRSLRTSLLLATTGRPPRLILFTSATPSEGKTTTASNLACILAHGDARVLLIDADLRRPTIHHRFGLAGKLGLTTVLAGTATLEEAIQHIPDLPNLDVLPSGPVPPFPSEMLSSDAMKALMERLAKEYTHVVVDSPPILSVTDAVILGRIVDAVVLVVRHGKPNKNVMRRARDLLVRSGAPIAGMVLNAVDINSPDYYGYYGYTGYSYGSMDGSSWDTQGPVDQVGAGGNAKR